MDKRDKRIPELCWNTGVVSRRNLLGGGRVVEEERDREGESGSLASL